MERVNILQLNVGRRRYPYFLLMQWLNKQTSLWILCLQEPYLQKKGFKDLPDGYQGVWCRPPNLPSNKVFAAIIFPISLKAGMITQRSSPDCVVLHVSNKDRMLSIISLYCSFHTTIHASWELVKQECRLSSNVIVCSNLNAHHHAWGSLPEYVHRRCRSQYSRGRQIYDLLDELNLCILNVLPHEPTFVRLGIGSSHIDASFASENLVSMCLDWMIDESLVFTSDHKPITFTIGYVENIESNAERCMWRTLTKKQEQVLASDLQTATWYRRRMNTEDDVDRFVMFHTMEVRARLLSLFGQKKKQKKEKYWWTSDVNEAHEKMDAIRERWRQNKTPDLYSEYVVARDAVTKEIDNAKFTSWKHLLAHTTDPWHTFFRIINATNVGLSSQRTLKSIDGMYAESMEETLTKLSMQFFPDPLPMLSCHVRIERQVEAALLNCLNCEPFTWDEFQYALFRMSLRTAPGDDGVTGLVLKHLVQSAKLGSTYLAMYNTNNRCLMLKFFPSSWKSSRVVLVPKNSDDMLSTKSLRPISLTSNFSKLYERLLLGRIMHYLEMSSCITPSQHAYRIGRSTVTALYEAVSFIQEAMSRGRVCALTFLDISGAFDRTWHHGILMRLLEYGVPPYLVAAVRAFLTDRTAHLYLAGHHHETKLCQGCPQGGVLSPILWNVLFNDMLLLPSGPCTKTIGYADDGLLITSATTCRLAAQMSTRH